MSEQVTQPILTTLNVGTPSVNVIGTGGAGINLVRLVLPHLNEKATSRYIDTSSSNNRPGEKVILINGDGSGSLRSENSDIIARKVTTYSGEDLNLADINIVVFSLSGGSGSVCGPLLIRDIVRRGKLAVAVVVISSEAERKVTNSINTIKSLENITSTSNIYLPIMFFDNKFGQEVVDKSLSDKLERLVDILTLPAAELDRNDRLNWINAPKVIGATSGLRLLHVECGGSTGVAASEYWPGIDDDYIVDSVLNIRTQSERLPSPTSRASYTGIFTTVKIAPSIGIIGNKPDAFKPLTADLAHQQARYTSQSGNKSAVISVAQEEVDQSTGLVL